jgi:general secretion pathway protein J
MRRAAGFTLVEMLVALGIFALLGLMSSQLVGRIMDVQEAVGVRGERLAAIQRTMDLLQRDVLQAINRSVRDELGDSLAPLRVAPDAPLEITRLGLRNPLDLPRSDEVRVAYTLRDGTLYRSIWGVLDRANDSVPLAQTLLEDVDGFAIDVVDVSGNEHGFWPPIGDVATDPAVRIAGIKLTLTLAPFGELQRIWDVAHLGPGDLPLQVTP